MIFGFLKRFFAHKKSEDELALERAFEMGEEAYSDGEQLEDNPFPVGSPLFSAWEEGYEDRLRWNYLGLK
jgi:hypothetical protein